MRRRIHAKLYFVLVIFVGMNLSIAAITSDLKLTVTRWTKQAFPCSKFLSPGVSFGQIQHLRGLNSIVLGYLNFTAGLT